MTWQPLKKVDNPLLKQSKKDVIKYFQKILEGGSRLANKKVSGKQIRKMALNHYKRSLKEEVWINNIYDVSVNKFEYGPLIHLSIKLHDKSQIFGSKWQHFQWIKNDILGEDYEAVELYPSESRMVNTANQYHLWALKDKGRFNLGWDEGRIINSKSNHGAVQTLEEK